MKRSVKKISFSRGQPSGFTLMEVMVTFTILGFIILMVFGVFRLGLSAWEKGESTKDEYQRMRIASQLISQQLKSIFPYKIKSEKAEGDFLAFEGSARSVKFVSTLSLKSRKPSGLVYVVYEFEEGGKGGGRLLIYERRVTTKNFMEEETPSEEKVSLFQDLSDVRFEYYREEDPDNNRAGGWVEEWNAKEEKDLPKGIRVHLVPLDTGKQNEAGSFPLITASLPANRYEDLNAGPLRRAVPPVTP